MGSSFDSASLAILDKLNTIEELLRTPNGHGQNRSATLSDVGDETRTLSKLKSLNSPSLERTKDPAPCHMNIEGVLAWHVFDDLHPDLDLKGLLNATDHGAPPTVPMVTEFDEHFAEEDLVESFMNNVFIYNPVLEEAKVQRYMRDARFNGIGWDAQSCLLVSDMDDEPAEYRLMLLVIDLRTWFCRESFRQHPPTRCHIFQNIAPVQASPVILHRCPETNGPAIVSHRGVGGTMLLSCWRIPDGYSETVRGMEDVCASPCLLSGILHQQVFTKGGSRRRTATSRKYLLDMLQVRTVSGLGYTIVYYPDRMAVNCDSS